MSIDIRVLAAFDKIVFTGPGELTLRQSGNTRLTLDGPEALLNKMESSVVDGTLYLGLKSGPVVCLADHKAVVRLQLELCELTELVSRGSGNVTVPDLDTDKLAVNLKGSGNLNLHKLTADLLEVRQSGSGNLKIAGDVEQQNLLLSGSGAYQAEALVSDIAAVKLTGSARVGLMAHDELDVVIQGSGHVSYLGYPHVNKTIHGSGKVIRLRRGEMTTRGTNHA